MASLTPEQQQLVRAIVANGSTNMADRGNRDGTSSSTVNSWLPTAYADASSYPNADQTVAQGRQGTTQVASASDPVGGDYLNWEQFDDQFGQQPTQVAQSDEHTTYYPAGGDYGYNMSTGSYEPRTPGNAYQAEPLSPTALAALAAIGSATGHAPLSITVHGSAEPTARLPRLRAGTAYTGGWGSGAFSTPRDVYGDPELTSGDPWGGLRLGQPANAVPGLAVGRPGGTAPFRAAAPIAAPPGYQVGGPTINPSAAVHAALMAQQELQSPGAIAATAAGQSGYTVAHPSSGALSENALMPTTTINGDPRYTYGD